MERYGTYNKHVKRSKKVMLSFIIMFTAQLAFQLSRTLGTRVISKDHMGWTLVMTVIIQALWLVTTAMGVHAVFEMNWPQITAYMIGGVVGAYLAMKIDFHK